MIEAAPAANSIPALLPFSIVVLTAVMLNIEGARKPNIDAEKPTIRG